MLTALCEQIESIPISGVVVVGDGQAARSIALSGNAMKVPVLWAKGGSAQLHAGGSEVKNRLLHVFDIFNPLIYQDLLNTVIVSILNPTFHMSAQCLFKTVSN